MADVGEGEGRHELGFVVWGKEEGGEGAFGVDVLGGGLQSEDFGGCVVELGGCQWE